MGSFGGEFLGTFPQKMDRNEVSFSVIMHLLIGGLGWGLLPLLQNFNDGNIG